jgi:Virulence-associated protein E-like domain
MDATTNINTVVHVTFFANHAAATLTAENLTLAELAERVRNASARDKDKLPWLKLAKFGRKRSEGNSLRNNANITEITGIEIDYDIEIVGFDDAVRAVRELGIHALLYTSASHTPEKPRWRILAPTSKPYPPEMRARLVARLNGYLKQKFGSEIIAKSESFTLSQAFLFGWVCTKPNAGHRAEVIDGSFIDLRADLETFEASGGPPSKKTETYTGTAGTSSIDWTIVEKHKGWLKSAADLPSDFSTKGRAIIVHSGNLKDLQFDLDHAGLALKPYASWSEVSFALVAIFKADGRFSNEQIAAAALADLECNQHITKITNEANQRRAVERLIMRSYAQAQPKKWRNLPTLEWRERRNDGSPLPSMHNARLAIVALGIECKYDTFHNKLLFGYQDDTTRHTVEQIVGEVSDNGIIALRQRMSDTFGFDLTDKHTRDAVISLALERCFDPVADVLNEAEANWDGVERLDRMAVEYFNCEDTELNAAFIRKTMIAGVARVRSPGVKHDEITVLESEEGFNKSTAWRVLAGDENFSDESIIGKDSREVQEQLVGIWIHENADLAGMKKAEVETIKTFASRMVDRARPAYGHFVKKQKRHSIEVGTTNSDKYLQSQTGNRRFWPLRVLKTIHIEKLRRNRLQLWGEAAHYQSRGESLVLDERLWAAAGGEQERRRITDPWEDILRNMPEMSAYRYFSDGVSHEGARTIIHHEGDEERVLSQELLTVVLNISPGNQRVEHLMRLSIVMKKLGWERNANGYVSITGIGRAKGYYRTRGERPE